jgi:putative ABC transport system permease protein
MATLGIAGKIGTEALRVNPMRTALSTLGVIIGVASLVAVLSLGDGMERTARLRLQNTSGIQSVSVSSRTVESVDGDFFPVSDTVALEERDAAAMRAIPGIVELRLAVRGRVEVRTDNGGRRMATVGALEGTADSSRAVAHGRWFAAADDSATSATVVLSHRLATRLQRDAVASLIGTMLRTADDSARVIGIEPEAAGDGLAALTTPYRFASRFFAASRILPHIEARVATVEDVGPVQQRIEAYLATRSPVWKSRFEIGTYRARAEQVAQGILIFKLLMGAITGISLIVGGIGIMNVLLASVSERTREIGIRRATGATRRDILLQFLSESVAISGFGSVIGIVLGLLAAYGLTAAIRRFAEAAFVRASFSWGSVVAAAIASLAVGLLFGTYPARRASQLTPIDAIRHE